jgi:hypothetical protein
MNEAPKVPGNNTLPQGTNPAGGGNSKSQAITQGINQGAQALDSITDKLAGDSGATPELGEQVVNNEPQVDENGNPVEEPQYNPGDKVAPGYEVGEDGKVKQSATSRLQSAVAGGAAAYFSGGNAEAAKAAKDLSNSKTGRRISDALEKNVAVKKTAEAAEEAGALDVTEGAIDAIAAAKNMDVKALAENAKKLKKGKKKLQKFVIKRLVLTIVMILLPVIFGVASLSMIVIAIGDENDTSSGQIYENTNDYDWPDVEDEDSDDPGTGGGGGGDDSGGGGGGGSTVPGEPITDEKQRQIISEIPGFDSLSEGRKAVIRAAVSAVGLNYLYGGKPTGPGLSGIPSSGIDCSGFVRWALWTGLGNDPGFSGTSNMVSNMNTWFDRIEYDQMLPGDIVVRLSNKGGHTAIYLGNNTYVHARGARYGIAVSTNSNHSYYQYKLRYRGI